MDISLPGDFKEFLKLLDSHAVEYRLIGGYAVSYHGYPRSTQDLDIWIGLSESNARRVVDVLADFGFAGDQLSESLFLTPGQVIRMGVAPIRIEILTSASGVDFSHCFQSRLNAAIDGVPVNLIDLSSLKANKKAAGRHKDLDDLEHLP